MTRRADIIRDELSRIGLLGEADDELVRKVAVRVQVILADPEFLPFDPKTNAFGTWVEAERERYRWAAMRAAHELRARARVLGLYESWEDIQERRAREGHE
jgi:hypothetical protein